MGEVGTVPPHVFTCIYCIPVTKSQHWANHKKVWDYKKFGGNDTTSRGISHHVQQASSEPVMVMVQFFDINNIKVTKITLMNNWVNWDSAILANWDSHSGHF